MPVKIKEIEAGSQAERLGILPGESVLIINGHKISTFLDLQYHGADDQLKIKIKRLNGAEEEFLVDNVWENPLGIIPEDHTCRQCINHCIFCFIDQMAPNQRDTLYIKDDDYGFSFVFGNFITLTNLSERDYKKIFEQRLSPLYISVHTTNPKLHKEMLNYTRDFNIMDELKRLNNNEIEFHTQIVLVPGYNDGEELERTLNDLDGLGYNCLSIGIVPVGLTRFRDNLTTLKTVDTKDAKNVIDLSNKYTRTFCSDEFYLKAEVPIPEEEFYEDFPQLENGIGMIRYMLSNWEMNKTDFLEDIAKIKERLVFVCGTLAADTINKITREINQIMPGKARIMPVTNHFLGETVTVTGLLTWQDINKQVKLESDEIMVFSSNSFNTEEKTIDGTSKDAIISYLNKKIIVIEESFSNWETIDQ